MYFILKYKDKEGTIYNEKFEFDNTDSLYKQTNKTIDGIDSEVDFDKQYTILDITPSIYKDTILWDKMYNILEFFGYICYKLPEMAHPYLEEILTNITLDRIFDSDEIQFYENTTIEQFANDYVYENNLAHELILNYIDYESLGKTLLNKRKCTILDNKHILELKWFPQVN